MRKAWGVLRPFAWLIAITVFGIAIGVICAVGGYIYLWHVDFREAQVEEFLSFRVPLLTEIYDDDGKKLAELPGLKSGSSVPYYRKRLAYKEIPKAMVNAALAAEDKRFFEHNGVDYVAVGRAVKAIIGASVRKSFREHRPEIVFAEGASTITQQAVRLVFLSDELQKEQRGYASKQEKLLRKIKEIRMALWLESRLADRCGDKQLAKQKIFEVFSNISYCGHGRYGFASSADFYFGKPLSEVNPGEAAMLAGLLHEPADYSPHRRKVAARIRRNQVLALMRDMGALREEDAARYRSMPIEVAQVPREKTAVSSVVGYVIKELWGNNSSAISWENGVMVKTYIKRSWQVAAQGALERGLEQYTKRHPEFNGKAQGAVVILGNDGKIRAMVGGSNVNYTSFNRAVEAKRQPGSAFKPFVYLTAIEKGWRLSEVWEGNGPFRVLDSPVFVAMGRGKQAHPIDNYDGRFLKSIELWQALAESRNAATVRLGMLVTPEAVVDTARRLGINQSVEAYPTTAIGAEEVSPLELAGAYLPLANGGIGIEPYLIKSVRSPRRGEYKIPVPASQRIISEEAAVQIIAGLRHVVLWQNGTGRKLRGLPFPVAGKTGTSSDFRDAWFCGYTYGAEGVTACVWVGMDDGTPLGDSAQCAPRDLVRREFCEPGGRVALPIFEDVMRRIYTNENAPAFPPLVEERVRAAHANAVLPPKGK